MTEKISSVGAYAGSGGAIAIGFTLNEWAGLVGILCALATFAMNAYFKWRHLKLAESRTMDCEECPLR